MPEAKEYIAIREWHRRTGSLPYYWSALQRKAEEEDAPIDSIYQDGSTGEWHTVSGLKDGHVFRETMKGIAV